MGWDGWNGPVPSCLLGYAAVQLGLSGCETTSPLALIALYMAAQTPA